MAVRVANGLRCILDFFRGKSKERCSMLQENEKRSRTSLVSLQRLQGSYPRCTWIVEKLGSAKHELVVLLEKHA